MRKAYQLISFALIIALGTMFYSCEKQDQDNPKGSFEFSLSLDDGLKSVQDSIPGSDGPVSDSSAGYFLQLLITVVNQNGEAVFEDELIPLYSFGSGFVSGRIEMETGRYRLTRFLVIDSNNKVIFAAPLEGSPKSYLVNDPLPLGFQITPGQLTRVVPQVLSVGNASPSEFGYASFGFQVIRPLPFFAKAIIDNPLNLAPTQLTTAGLKVMTSNGWSHQFRMEASLNKFYVPAGAESYLFIVYKEGFPVLEYKFTERQLRASSENKPLVFRFPSSNLSLIELQPGPVAGKDATITDLDPDKNLGDYQYFEASFLSEPVLTVMRTKLSFIWFNMNEIPKSARIEKVLLTLSFETPLWDTTINFNESSYTDNHLILQQIVEPWNEYEVSWNNQPQTISANQVKIPWNPQMSSNRRVVDVTSLYVPIQEVAAPNYGMMLRFPEDMKWPGMRFASSDHPIKEMRPKLSVYFSYKPD